MNPAGRAALLRLADQELAAIAPCLDRAARVELRDVAVGRAIERFYSEMSATAAAKALAVELAVGGTPGTAKGDAVCLILALNSGRPLGATSLRLIAGGGKLRSNSCFSARSLAAPRSSTAAIGS